MTLQKPDLKERFDTLEAEIRAARRHLERRRAESWAAGIGGLLEGLSHELDEIGHGHAEPHDEAQQKFDSIEKRLDEVKGRMATKDK